MSCTEKIKHFNEIFISLLLQVAPHCGMCYYTYTKKLLKVNSTIAIKHFVTNLIQHKDQIFAKDESFLEDENKFYDVEIYQDIVNNKFTIISIKELYGKLSDDSKQSIWWILQSLIQLAIEYEELSKSKKSLSKMFSNMLNYKST